MNQERLGRGLILLGAGLMVVFFVTPLGYMVFIAANRSADLLGAGFGFEATAAHFRAVAASATLHFWSYLANSLIVSGFSAAMCVAVAAPAAYAITRLDPPGKVFILFFVLGVSMFPPVSLVSFLFKLMTALGLINTHPALILPYVAWTLPLALWVLTSYFAQIPKDLDKAAVVDGCSPMQALIKVILPVAAPGLVSTGILAFIFAFNEFLFALMLTTDHHARTIPVGMALFRGLHGRTAWGEVMAAATLTTLPVIGLTLIFQRRIVQGLTRGAVKG